MPASASSVMTREELRESIIKKKIFPLYLFHGDETFLMDEITDLMVGQLLNDSSRNFNYDVIDEADARDVVSIVTAFPMESEKRMVVVKDIEKIENIELLIPIFERPVDTSVLILRTVKADFRTKIYRLLQQTAVVVNFKYLFEGEIIQWISRQVKKAGKEIPIDASELLQSYVGRSLRDLKNEIEKLLVFVGTKNEIHADDVNAVVGISRDFNIFQLQKTFAKKDLPNAMKILQRMLDAGESPIKIVSMLTKYFLNIWAIQEMSAKHLPNSEIVKSLNIKEFSLKEYETASQLYTSAELENAFRIFIEADEALKSSRPPEAVLSLLLYTVISGKPEPYSSSWLNP